MLKEIKNKTFGNGAVYALQLSDGMLIETTDTFLPAYTKNCINNTNQLKDYDVGTRQARWMIGVSVMSGCPVKCKFCATGKLKKCRNLTADEIVSQIEFILNKNPTMNPKDCFEFKINYTRMGEPFLNIEAIKQAIKIIDAKFPNTHHYISTIGIKNMDTSWIQKNITLQLSLHSLNEEHRNSLIPYKNKLTIEELGHIKTNSNLKTTLNMTLVEPQDFDIKILKKHFNQKDFFIKLSPINKNEISIANNLGDGIIKQVNLL
jgi:adenine C2-methylase RlmN of 23S rRNA A2503 and tRNA A37